MLANGTGLTSMNRTLRALPNVAPCQPRDYHPGAMDEPDLWDIFYQLYPRHEARKDALKAWSRLSDSDRLAAVTAIADWRQVWRAQGRELHHVPLPASWLNGERWTDEVPKGVISHLPATAITGSGNPNTGDAHPTPRAQIPAHVLAMFAKIKEGK